MLPFIFFTYGVENWRPRNQIAVDVGVGDAQLSCLHLGAENETIPPVTELAHKVSKVTEVPLIPVTVNMFKLLVDEVTPEIVITDPT